MTTEAERRDALRREVLRAQQEIQRRQAEAARAQPSPAQPPGGVTANPEAVDDLQARLPAMARGFRDTAMFGLDDEFRGLLGAIDPNDTYQGARDDVRYQTMLDEADYPGARLVGQMVGGATAGLAVAGPIDDALRAVPGLRGTGTAARIGRGAGAGMVEGAAYGAGSGEGFDDRFSQALTYGGLGAAAGAAVPTAAEIARRLVLRPVGGALGVGNQSRAANSVVRTMEEAGMTADEIDTALRRAAVDGQDMFNVADVMGYAGQRTLAGVARQPGAGRTAAERALNARQNDSTDRLAQFVTEAMDSRNTRAQQTAAERVARGAAGDINYSAARANAQPVDVRGVLSLIDERIGPMRNTTVQGEGVDATLDGIRRRLAGVVQEGEEALPAELSDLPRLVRLYGEIGDGIQEATRAGRGFEASQLRDVQTALGRALEDASPDWRTANANFAGASRVVEAPDAGQAANAPGSRFADVADEWSAIETRIRGIQGLTPEEQAQYIADARQAFRTGYANRDLASIEGARRDTRNMADSLFNNTRQQQNYGLMATDPETFFRRVDREGTMSDTRFQALGGSQTASNQADMGMVNGEDIAMFGSAASGNFPALGAQLLARASNAARGQNEATREAIARALLSNNPDELRRLLATQQGNDAVSRTIAGIVRGGSREPAYQAVAR